MKKIIPLVFLFLGESVAISSEIIAAKNVQSLFHSFWRVLGLMALVAVAGVFLILGYMLGMKYLQNIWVVGAVSIASIVIVEPVVTYLIFQELPGRGALIGLVLAVLAILSALFIK